MSRHTTCSVALNTKVCIPGHMPKAAKIIRATACPLIDSSDAISRKVVLRGHIHIDIEYVGQSFRGIDSIYWVSFDLPLLHYIDCSKAKENYKAAIAAEVEYQHYELLSEGELSIYVIVKLSIMRLIPKELVSKPNQIIVAAALDASPLQPCQEHKALRISPRRPKGWNGWTNRYRH